MIRPFREKEIDDLIVIWEKASAIGHHFLGEEFLKNEKWLMRNKFLPGSDTLVYESAGELLGFVSLKENEIMGLFVDPEHHRLGIASSLINHLDMGPLSVEVFEQNQIALPFYQHHGFYQTEVYFHDETQQRMIKMSQNIKMAPNHFEA